MLIECLEKYRAILPFKPLELPPLTVLTGLNGSGKTQFLTGLHRQHIRCDLFESPPLISPLGSPSLTGSVTHSEHPQITLLRNWSSDNSIFSQELPTKLGARFGNQSRGQTNHLPAFQFESKRTNLLRAARASLDDALGRSAATILAEDEDPWRLGVQELVRRADIAAAHVDVERITEIFREAASALEFVPLGTISPMHKNDYHFHSEVRRAAVAFGFSQLEVTESMMQALSSRIETPMFNPNIVAIMADYRDRLYGNDLDELQARRDSAKPFFRPEQIADEYGPEPWNILSDLLSAMSLPFQVVRPSAEIAETVRLRFRPNCGGDDLSFDDLSSGEQILTRFAISVIRPRPNMVGLQRPLLLLLDEMDASLHPEMTQRWLSAVERGIVGELGIHVILTTHSPTTVALAPENAIFAMVEGRPQRASKQEAINKLTFGVPTLSIDYSGRRQVFCESDTDAAVYERIYAALKPRLTLRKEINFIGTGIRNKRKSVMVGEGEEINSGEAVVRKIVNSLASLNVNSVFGLIDWDSRATPTERIFVIGSGTHYTIENILLDPLLIGVLMVLERMAIPNLVFRGRGLESLDQLSLQQIADAIQNILILPDDDGSMIEVKYFGGVNLKIRKRYASIPGHDLECRLAANFCSLRKYTLKRGALAQRIAEVVITDYPEFCPSAISETFEKISTWQAT